MSGSPAWLIDPWGLQANIAIPGTTVNASTAMSLGNYAAATFSNPFAPRGASLPDPNVQRNMSRIGRAYSTFYTTVLGGEALAALACPVATTTLYRAVSPAEYYSAMGSQKFSYAAGQMEAKQFGLSLAETLKFANFSSDYAAIVSADVPTSSLNALGFANPGVDPFIFTSGTVTVEGQSGLQLLNSVIGAISHAF